MKGVFVRTVSKWIFVGISCFVLSFNTKAAQTVYQRLQEDFQTGRISYIQKLTYEGYWIFDPTRLPEPYLGLQFEVAKCATGIISALKDNWDKLNPEDQIFFASYLSRPDLPETYITPQGYFKLHYTTAGINRVPLADENYNDIPDFIEQAGSIFDYCWSFEIDTLGYQSPPGDFGIDGNEIDVYFRNLDAYGYTIPEDPIPSTPYEDYSSYIVLDNDFSGPGFYTHGLDALKVTAAHEFFHVIQLGYQYREHDVFFMEWSSVWMEDIVYDEVNDYYGYLSYFFDQPDLPLIFFNGSHEYGAAIWLRFLSERFDRNIVKQMWNKIREKNAMETMKEVLNERGSSLCEEFSTFAIWNYFTKSRAKYYREAANYPEIHFSSNDFVVDVPYHDSTAFLSTKYYNFVPQKPGYFQLHQQINNLYTGLIAPSQISVLTPSTTGEIGYASGLDSVVIIAINCNVPNDYWTYQSQAQKYFFSYCVVTQQFSGCDKVWPNPFIVGKHQEIVAKFNLPEESVVDFCIFTESGRKVKTFPMGLTAAGSAVAKFPWDGTLDSGDRINSGVYIAAICGNGVFLSNKLAVIRK